MKTPAILGTWTLVSWYNESGTGERSYPFTENATGYISYAPDGFVFVHLSTPDRQIYAINDALGGTLAEVSAAMKSHITYAGTYDFSGDHVSHHVVHASCPNWVGTTQERDAKFHGDRLRLSASGIFLNGQEVKACLEWQRA